MNSEKSRDGTWVAGRARAGRRPGRWLLAGLLGLAALHGVGAATFGIDRASLSSSDEQGNGDSFDPAPSADGRFVAFRAVASNLVPTDVNESGDVFVRDRMLGTTDLVSLDGSGGQGNGFSFECAISADGRIVAFRSHASNLVAGDTNGQGDIFVRDRQLATTERVSVATGGGQANGISLSPVVSWDGRFVAFQSAASNLVAGDGNDNSDIFVRDRLLATTERVSVGAGGSEGFGNASAPAISGDGRFVAFESGAWNLVPGDTNGRNDVFVRDRLRGTTTRASVGSGGVEGDGSSFVAGVSGDGRFVVFYSQATNLVAGDTNGQRDVFVRDQVLGTTERVSVDSAGAEANGFSDDPSISNDGRFVAFRSEASNLVAGDTNNLEDVFVHDRITGATVRISEDIEGGETDGRSQVPKISADGRYVAFYSYATHLVTEDTNQAADAFVAANPLLPEDAAPPAIGAIGSGGNGTANGLPWLALHASDSGRGVQRLQLTGNSTNCHLEFPLGTRLSPGGTPPPHTLSYPIGIPEVIAYVVKDAPEPAQVELEATDTVGNTAIARATYFDLHLARGKKLTRTVKKLPAEAHYLTLQNGSSGFTRAKLWVNGKLVFGGFLEDGQVVRRDVALWMRPGTRNTIKVTLSGPSGADAALLTGFGPF